MCFRSGALYDGHIQRCQFLPESRHRDGASEENRRLTRSSMDVPAIEDGPRMDVADTRKLMYLSSNAGAVRPIVAGPSGFLSNEWDPPFSPSRSPDCGVLEFRGIIPAVPTDGVSSYGCHHIRAPLVMPFASQRRNQPVSARRPNGTGQGLHASAPAAWHLRERRRETAHSRPVGRKRRVACSPARAGAPVSATPRWPRKSPAPDP